MEDFLIYLLKSTGLLSLFFIFYSLLLKRDTSFRTNRKFLLAGLITSAILPAIYLTRTVIVKAQLSQFQLTEATFPATEMVVQESEISPLEIIASLYFLGVVVMFIRLIMQFISLSGILMLGKFSADGKIKLVEISKRIAPFSFLNYIVYNPALHSTTELEYILKHEKVHVSQWHTVDVLLANLNLIYQWFNPFAWSYLKSIQQNLEFIADREAVKKASCKKEYQKALVKISVENFNIALTNNFYQSLIKKRILMLNSTTSNKNTSLKAILISPAIIAFLFLFNVKTVAQVQGEEKETETSYELDTDFEISFQILNTTKEEQLKIYSKMLQKNNVQLDFEDVTRNDAGLITGITAKILDNNTNSSGSVSRQNDEGIQGFTVYYNDKEGSGFKSLEAKFAGGGAKSILRDIGESPLFVIEGKKYTYSQMEGKTVKIQGEVSSIASGEAVEMYGNSAKDGAIIITKGTIIDDFKTELKEIDSKDLNAVNDYIQIEKGKRPVFINLNKNVAAKASKIKKNKASQKSAEAVTIKSISNGKNPIYVINGKILGPNASLDSINPESIKGINVLKGSAATSVYGMNAKDGAIIISTLKSGDTTGFSFRTGNLVVRDSATGKNIRYEASNVKFIELDSLSPSRRKFTLTQSGSNYYDAPLYIVDGKEMDADFEMSSIDHNKIEKISVIKGAEAVEKFGEKAKGGLVEITTKTNMNIDMGALAIVTSSASKDDLQEFRNRLKGSGIDAKFDRIKRNKAGLITDIKIIAKHKNKELSATYSEDKGIPQVYVGLMGDQLIVSSNPPK